MSRSVHFIGIIFIPSRVDLTTTNQQEVFVNQIVSKGASLLACCRQQPVEIKGNVSNKDPYRHSFVETLMFFTY